ncbi:MAG: IclR family transcriptional regulator [Alphaproteobacteria bacterium]|nr:IclR family transcriptional regulator [Alphaproteobacteria bacterium]
MPTPKNLSVQKAFTLLRSFRGPEEWLTNAELSRRSGLSEPSSHRLMKTLEEVGAVVRNRRGWYRPGMVLATLSKDVAIGDLIRATSEDVLRRLASDLGGVVHIGALKNNMVTYTAKFGESKKVSIPSCVGMQQEAYCSALGKVLLAGLSHHELEDFLHDGNFVSLTPQTITTIGSLRAEIVEVRERGFSVDNKEVFQTICCVGAPIHDPDGNTVAAISFADTAMNLCSTWQQEVHGRLMSAKEKVSRKIFPLFEMAAH